MPSIHLARVRATTRRGGSARKAGRAVRTRESKTISNSTLCALSTLFAVDDRDTWEVVTFCFKARDLCLVKAEDADSHAFVQVRLHISIRSNSSWRAPSGAIKRLYMLDTDREKYGI
jgi:hypothetical protein